MSLYEDYTDADLAAEISRLTSLITGTAVQATKVQGEGRLIEQRAMSKSELRALLRDAKDERDKRGGKGGGGQAIGVYF